jgi:hypothetical protein
VSSLDDFAVYVFVRQDLSEQDQRIQIAHAVLKMALTYRPAEANYRVVELDGGESKKAFDRTVRKMPERGVQYVIYEDSDRPEWGPTAIATIPMAEQKLPHKLRRNSPPAEASAAVALDGQRGASSCSLSSEKEHQPTKLEVGGSIPSASSRVNCS